MCKDTVSGGDKIHKDDFETIFEDIEDMFQV
ncbi:hypothetical protein BMS3Bbin15_01703 [archaeon BMS3Bbin15]|nr:hypothetical protein BMS3Bbin15_01703 [archaeon BMS3Bbin15]